MSQIATSKSFPLQKYLPSRRPLHVRRFITWWCSLQFLSISNHCRRAKDPQPPIVGSKQGMAWQLLHGLTGQNFTFTQVRQSWVRAGCVGYFTDYCPIIAYRDWASVRLWASVVGRNCRLLTLQRWGGGPAGKPNSCLTRQPRGKVATALLTCSEFEFRTGTEDICRREEGGTCVGRPSPAFVPLHTCACDCV